MVTGAAPEVRDGFRAAAARVALAGMALGLACHPSRPPAADATAPAIGETATVAVPPPRGKQIVIAYSSNILGEYEPCG